MTGNLPLKFDWQFVVVVACVVWAAAVLVMRGYRLFRTPSSTSCGSGGCHACPSNTTQRISGLIQLDASIQFNARDTKE
jgi:hypothetical protein